MDVSGSELDQEGELSLKIQELAEEKINPDAWNGTRYHPNRSNFKDRIVSLSEEIASWIEGMMKERQLTSLTGRYLEIHVNELLENGGR